MEVMESLRYQPHAGLIAAGRGTRVALSELADGTAVLTASEDLGRPVVRIEVDLADAVGHWVPGGRGARTLPPDWAPTAPTSLVQSAPFGALYNAAGRVLLGWAAAEPVVELSVRSGVSEEGKSFVVELAPTLPLDHDLVLLIDDRGGKLAEVVAGLAGWVSSHCAGLVLKPPAFTMEPVYSTWYTFSQDINNDRVSSEAELAMTLGFGSVFIDDGWQRLAHGRGYQGCGDWQPDQDKFPDLAETVSALHSYGLKAGLWIAPLLVGAESQSFAVLAECAPLRQDLLNCWVLDPRLNHVRTHVAETCLRLVSEYAVDLLKIDFLEQAMVYRDHAGNGDVSDVGTAMAIMLEGVRRRLDEAGHPEVAIEFRQPYVSPALARYGHILRANDCPGDNTMNRASTIDSRLSSVGQVVHSDPIMWGASAGAEAIAQQLYAVWFSVPQVSIRLKDLSVEQRDALTGLLALWRETSAVSLHGELEVDGAERNYHLVKASTRGRTVIARYAPCVVELGPGSTGETTILNATPDTRLTLRMAHEQHGVLRSASGQVVSELATVGPGLVDLPVPAFGSVTLLLNG